MTCTCWLTLESIGSCLGQNNLRIINLLLRRSQEHQTDFRITFKYYVSLGINRDLGVIWRIPPYRKFDFGFSAKLLYLWALCKSLIRIVLVRWYFLVEIEKCAVLKLLDICPVKFEWKIANIFARFWKSAQYCHWAILPCSAFSFRPVDSWNRKSQIFPKHGRILKFKHQQCYKLIKTFL